MAICTFTNITSIISSSCSMGTQKKKKLQPLTSCVKADLAQTSKIMVCGTNQRYFGFAYLRDLVGLSILYMRNAEKKRKTRSLAADLKYLKYSIESLRPINGHPLEESRIGNLFNTLDFTQTTQRVNFCLPTHEVFIESWLLSDDRKLVMGHQVVFQEVRKEHRKKY